MDLRLLLAFVQVADSGSFGEAAERLSITQPALTKQIQSLESALGLVLFRRGRRGAELTAAGAALLGDARAIVDLAQDFRDRARRMADGEEGHLAVGFGLSGITVAPRAVAAFRRRSPRVSVRLEDLPSSIQIERILNGRLDVAFTRLPAPDRLRSLPVLADRLAIAYPAERSSPPERADELADWLGRQHHIRLRAGRGPGLAAQVAGFLAAAGARPESFQDADDLQTVLALVSAGAGIAIVPESAQHIAPPNVATVPLTHPGAAWTVGAVWRADNETPWVRAFLEELVGSGRREPSTR